MRRGLVHRRVDEANRRAHVLNLTPEGLALRRRLQPAALAANDRIMAPLLPGERAVLSDLMTRVIEGHSVYARPGNDRRAPRQRNQPSTREPEEARRPCPPTTPGTPSDPTPSAAAASSPAPRC